MAVGMVGDRLIVESERIGRPTREGEILEVLGAGEDVRYRVHWEDGHESEFAPSAGSVTIIHKAKEAGVP